MAISLTKRRQPIRMNTTQRGGAATEHSLSSMQWRRGSGRGGAPLLDPLPAPASRGEEEENAHAENRRGLRRFGQILIERNETRISRKLPQRIRRHQRRPNLRFRLGSPGTQAGRSGGPA